MAPTRPSHVIQGIPGLLRLASRLGALKNPSLRGRDSLAQGWRGLPPLAAGHLAARRRGHTEPRPRAGGVAGQAGRPGRPCRSWRSAGQTKRSGRNGCLVLSSMKIENAWFESQTQNQSSKQSVRLHSAPPNPRYMVSMLPCS